MARRLVKLGTVYDRERCVADQSGEDRKLLFLPANLPDGMEAADPMLGVAQRRLSDLVQRQAVTPPQKLSY